MGSQAKDGADRAKQARRLVLLSFPGATLWTLGDRRRGLALLVLSGLGLGLLVGCCVAPSGVTLLALAVWVILLIAAEIYEWVVVARAAAAAAEVPAKLGRTAKIGLMLLAIALIAGLMTFDRDHSIWQIPQSGMSPTIAAGDWVIAQRGTAQSLIKHNDIVVARLPDTAEEGSQKAGWVRSQDGSLCVVGRIVGMPGDKVEATESGISVNGTLLAGRGADEAFTKSGRAPGSWTVPREMFFLAGDAPESGSSASYGLVGRAQIAARPQTVLWSPELSRIGRDLQ